MIPHGTPTYAFSARWASAGQPVTGQRSRCAPARSSSAASVAHSSAAEDDRPAPTGTSEATASSGAGHVDAGLAQRPDHTGHVAGPAVDPARHQVGRRRR